ncbi:unnamed protein product [Prunus armeniaca]
MGVKLDISKAYDRVEWDFLERVMQKMGFNADWVHLVMSCVTTVNFTVVINGQSGDAFSPSHGIRQDLLQGIKLNSGGPILSHLLFANDTLIFLKATTQNCQNISCLLQAYCTASRQQVSLTRSNVVFSSNTPSSICASMCEFLCMPDVTNAGKYLGSHFLGQSKERSTFVHEISNSSEGTRLESTLPFRSWP